MTGHRRTGTAPAAAALLVVAAACGNGGDSPAADDAEPVSAERCVVRLHGKGSGGATSTLDDDGIALISPDGNGTGWGGLQWEYETEGDITAAADIITAAADGSACERYVVHGFSNGAAMAGALLCSDVPLDDRISGVIIDDPVTDSGTEGCRDTDVEVAIYWTGALDEEAPPGTRCDSIDWTCSGDVLRGIDAYAADVGVEVTPSPFDEHRWYLDTPLPLMWLG